VDLEGITVHMFLYSPYTREGRCKTAASVEMHFVAEKGVLGGHESRISTEIVAEKGVFGGQRVVPDPDVKPFFDQQVEESRKIY